ncbi:MAG: DUF4440 domain-containing protein, partial [Spirochaetota bacterium]
MKIKKRLFVAAAVTLAFFAGGSLQAQATFGTPVNLGPMINSGSDEGSPSVTADGLELYFHSDRAGGQGSFDVWVSKRASTSQSWGMAVNLGPVVNSAAIEVAPTVSSDGLELIFSDYVVQRPGGFGKTDLWVTKRASRTAAWSAPVNLGPLVNSGEDEITPVLSSNGLELILDSYRPGGLGASDLWVARRSSKSAAWGKPEWLGPVVNSVGVEHCPTISSDGLTLYFDRTPPGQEAEIGDLMVTTRASLAAPWGPPVNLGHVLSTHYAAHISADSKTLYYSASSPGGKDSDIWQVPISLDSGAIALWQDIARGFDEYEKGVNAIDTGIWLANWDEGGVKMMPNIAPIVGKDAISAFVEARWSSYESRDMTINLSQVEGFGPIAIARGTYLSIDKLKTAAAPATTEGWFMTVFRQQADGSWKIYRDTIGPLPAPAAK